MSTPGAPQASEEEATQVAATMEAERENSDTNDDTTCRAVSRSCRAELKIKKIHLACIMHRHLHPLVRKRPHALSYRSLHLEVRPAPHLSGISPGKNEDDGSSPLPRPPEPLPPPPRGPPPPPRELLPREPPPPA
jgi:hypothetical protein